MDEPSPSTRAADHALRGFGWLAFLGVLAASLHDASQAFDSWYYHLPFAARLAGLLPASSYIFHPANQARFEGLPLLAELFQGLLWRATGRAESANLVAFSAIPLVAWFLRRRWQVPPHLSFLGLLAVPLVQTHASSCYVDLPGNAAAATLVLLVVDAYAEAPPLSRRDVLLALLLCATAANIKPLLLPAVGVCLLAIFARVARERSSRPLAIAMVLASPLVLFTPLKNLVAHDNPFYPVGTRLLGLSLPGPEEPYASSPAWLGGYPRPLRFLVSILEIGIRPLDDPRRWTVDQWMPEETGGNRLGGFFGAYVVVLVALLVYRVARGTSRRDRVAGVVFALFTALLACMPQSHELRYYMSWMMVLVCLNLGLACRPPRAVRVPGPNVLGLIAAVSFSIVVASTRGAYAYPGGMTVRELVAAKVDARRLEAVPDGGEVCVRREPFNLLWADRFHAPRHYRVREAEEAGDCDGVPELP